MSKKWQLVPNGEVMVTDRYYDEALRLQVQNIMQLDADRLLAGFRETAGFIAGMDDAARHEFMKGKARYGGEWEDGLIGGHTMGHYLVALAQAVANPALSEMERDKVNDRLSYVVDSLKKCQDKTIGTSYEGYIFAGTLPTKEFTDNPALQFDNVEKGLCELFTQSWVPWYTMHKIVSGLNAAFSLAGNDTALKVVNHLAEWIIKRTEGWSEETHRTVLNTEYGGMNDCLYELYEINRRLQEKGDKRAYKDVEKIKEAAHSFDETQLFEKILEGADNVLNNTHANTTIPKFIGSLARYEVDDSEEKYLEYAKAFWDMVIEKHTYVTGGNSENEHFGEDFVLDKERTHVNNETCNTYNMLKYSRRLFAVTGEKKYLDYSENTLINAIMASQNHDTGFTTYFQPMATGYHKVFNTFDGNFWCCTGTGYENFTKLQRGIYFKGEGKVLVALFLASEYENEDYRIVQDCDLASSETVKIQVTNKGEKKLSDDIYIRIPTWVKGEATVSFAGKTVKVAADQEYAVISKDELSDGGEICISLPMGITCHNLPDGRNTYAFCYGPFVLSARLGNKKMATKFHGVRVSVPAERAVESDVLKITSEPSVEEFICNIENHLVKKPDVMEFELKDTAKELTFTTHYNQYTECYGIYWSLEC